MVRPKKDGGPAFPKPDVMDIPNSPGLAYAGEDGMSLRDYFAAVALGNGAVAVSDDTDEEIACYAETAYRVADAMLTERARKK